MGTEIIIHLLAWEGVTTATAYAAISLNINIRRC